jgi:hypothetical protein
MVDHVAGTRRQFLEGADERLPGLVETKPTSLFILLGWSSISMPNGDKFLRNISL